MEIKMNTNHPVKPAVDKMALVEEILNSIQPRRYTYDPAHPGRAIVYNYPNENVQTRVPAPVRKYLKLLANVRNQSQSAMCDEMLRQFLEEKPWQHRTDFEFLKPKVKRTLKRGGSDEEDLNWVLVNIILRYDTAMNVKATSENLGVSLSSFVFTAIYWWIREKNPPKSLRALMKME
jgi:hypothetical protein